MEWIAELKAEEKRCPFQREQVCITCGCLAWIYYDDENKELLDAGAGRCRLIPD